MSFKKGFSGQEYDFDSEFPCLPGPGIPKTLTKPKTEWSMPDTVPKPEFHPVKPTTKISFSIQNKSKKVKPVIPVASGTRPLPLRPPPSKPPVGFQPPTPVVQYPEALTNYIQRALAQATNEHEKQLIESEVMNIVAVTISRNKLWTCNWNARKLPNLDGMHIDDAKALGKRTNIQSKGEEEEFLADEHKAKRMKRFNENDAPRQVTAKKSKHQKHKERLAKKAKSNKSAPIAGTCTILEKTFYRQVSEPDPSLIRPEWVLQKALKMVIRKWKRKEVDYVYVCDQFKSMRQDMTMQRIKNEFTVKVYESHARLALENDDLNEFNQCQTKLKTLYESGIQGHSYEFAAYRVLYSLNSCVRKGEFAALLYSIQEITEAQMEHTFVMHAIEMKESIVIRNYEKFFRLYKICPNMGAYLVDQFIDIIRVQALRTIVRSYVPKVATVFISSCMAFEQEKDCLRFLKLHNATIIKSSNELGFFIDTKKSKIIA